MTIRLRRPWPGLWASTAAATVVIGITLAGLATVGAAGPAVGDVARDPARTGTGNASLSSAGGFVKAASGASPTAAKAPPVYLKSISAHDCTGILGKKIDGPDGKQLGLVTDVLVGADGRPRAAVIDFGGFLGVGSRKIAVDWRLLKLTPGSSDWEILLDLTRAEIQQAPEYKPDEASDKIVALPSQAWPSAEPEK